MPSDARGVLGRRIELVGLAGVTGATWQAWPSAPRSELGLPPRNGSPITGLLVGTP